MEINEEVLASSSTESPISTSCICKSDTREENFLCPVCNYCFDASTSIPGCRELPEECIDDTLISSSCLCTYDQSVCGNGHYCSKTDGCYKTECTTGKKINPDNHKQCIDDNDDKNFIERFIDEFIKK